MYEVDPSLIIPSDPDIRIWRYVDFAKFVSLIDSSTLHFTRLDQMEDQYEGAFSEGTFDAVVAVSEDEEDERLVGELNEQQRSVMNFVREVNRMSAFVNCWHMNEVESAAMWKIYSGSGIAIQSTFQRLADSFTDVHEPVYIGAVGYEDFIDTQMHFAEDAWVLPVMYKRRMFDYERELRALWLFPPNTNGELDLSLDSHPKGQPLNVNLNNLIERIYISPGGRGWFYRLARSILDKYGYSTIPVVSSALDDIPHTRSWKDIKRTDERSV